VLRGESPIDPRVTRSLLGVADWGSALELTERERDVLRLVSLGLANKQIALRLGIGVSTVKTHLSSVFSGSGSPTAPPRPCGPRRTSASTPSAEIDPLADDTVPGAESCVAPGRSGTDRTWT
jgi:DNA-binding CsgD family transcriptional regulator